MIHVEQTWNDSADTLRGDFFHERVDLRGYSCANGVRAERRVHLVSRALGLYGVADIVEFGDGDEHAAVAPVEYKVGRPKADDWDRIQLTAQAMCLEEMHDVEIEYGFLFYGETRRRERVELDSFLRTHVRELSARMHELFSKGETPVLARGARCRRCSLLEACLPEIGLRSASAYWAEHGEPLERGSDA